MASTSKMASKAFEEFSTVLREQLLQAGKEVKKVAQSNGGLAALLLEQGVVEKLFGFPSPKLVRLSVTARRAGTCAALGAVAGALLLRNGWGAAIGGGLGGALGAYTGVNSQRGKVWF